MKHLLSLLLLAGPLMGAEPTQRQRVLDAMKQRPDDFWPRGLGHVVLGIPGIHEDYKGYHEPGGSFSPAFGTFGISLWVTDSAGQVITTSDTLPLNSLRQRFELVNPTENLWRIRTVTPFYSGLWWVVAPGRSFNILEPKISGGNQLRLALRSVGPAGAPIRSLDWVGQRLVVNDRWTVNIRPKPVAVSLGHEGDAGWRAGSGRTNRWEGDDGWGYALFTLQPDSQGQVIINVRDGAIAADVPLVLPSANGNVKCELPEPQFAECLDAQLAHLLMGLSGNETRPGEPNNYPLNWLRDGAYVIVALARAGQLDTAKSLARLFAEQDFFGGFGSEADAPGLALWAITEVAVQAHDEEFNQWLWPHIERKAGLILEMLAATNSIRRPFSGPVVPQHTNRADLDLVCDAARDGLINGRMDWHRPVFFVNAVSYRGLLAAAQFAGQLKHTETSARWLARADALRGAWNAAFKQGMDDNERTCIAAIHPAFVLAETNAFMQGLERRWRQMHDPEGQLKSPPPWTYFNVAEAHQWLLLGRPDRAWSTLRWFWEHQASPGLFSWWEGGGEENTFHRWENIRGWVKPPHVTPHYWTAAEMLLLQLDMLVAVDESGAEPVLLIGAGIPADWLNEPMRVTGIRTRLGQVDWVWRDGRMVVRLPAGPQRVRLGPNFPRDAALEIR